MRPTRKSLAVATRLMSVRTRSHRSLIVRLTDSSLGPDHQRIAKLDRENEVAPPAKVNASVGKVSVPVSYSFKGRSCTVCAIGHPDCPWGQAADTEGTRTKDQREALCHPGLRVRKGYPQSPNSLQNGEDLGSQASWYVLSSVSSGMAKLMFGSRCRHWEKAGGAKEVVI